MSTAIGDPSTADLCAAIGLAPFRRLGLTASFVGIDYPPGCIVHLDEGALTKASIDVYGVTPSGPERGTRTVESGLPVYTLPYEPIPGNCGRDVVADGITLKVNSFFRDFTHKVSRTLLCAGTTAMAKALARSMATGSVPRLQVADPSVTMLSFCGVLRSIDLSALPAFVGSKVDDENEFDSSCRLNSSDLYVYVDFAVASPPDLGKSRSVTVGGHRMLASTSNGDGYCTYFSLQGSTGGSGREEIEASSSIYSASDADKTPADQCQETAQLLADFLDTAGLT